MKDLDIIKQIEKELNVKLKKLVKTQSISNCYTLNQDRQVTGISLYDCRIGNLNRFISPLKNLEKLTSLNLSSNQLSDISLLKTLKSLTYLNLHYNKVSNLSALKGLENLLILHLSLNELTKISSLQDLENLRELLLDRNQLRDISPLKYLNNL